MSEEADYIQQLGIEYLNASVRQGEKGAYVEKEVWQKVSLLSRVREKVLLADKVLSLSESKGGSQ